jgi:hypothetical protein
VLFLKCTPSELLALSHAVTAYQCFPLKSITSIEVTELFVEIT